MPRMAVRRKASTPSNNTNNNNEEVDAPKRKLLRVAFQLPLPERPNVVGRALVCGQGDMGQLGLGDDESKFERKRPALVDSIENVVDVRAGGMHNLVLTHEGIVYSFGCNDEGALGRDSSEDGSEFEPHPVELPGKVLKISAGDSHSASLLEDGRVFAWGSFRDSHGNMGLTLEGNKRLPIDVLPDTKCCDIASGADHLVILTCGGKVYTVGCGEQGQLGRVSLRSATGESRRGKTELLRPGEVAIKRGKPVDAIWATNYCTFLRESQTGKIWAFGLNNYKQLAYAKELATIINPVDTKFQNVKQIAGGQHHTLVLKNDGSCYSIGRSDYGRLGLGTVNGDVKELQSIKGLKGLFVVGVSCGEAQSFALTDDGKLYSWGMGSNYQLGTGSDDDALEPIQIISKQTEGKRIIRVSSGGQHSIFLVQSEVQPKPQSKTELGKSAQVKKASVTAVKEKETKPKPIDEKQKSTEAKDTPKTNGDSNLEEMDDDDSKKLEKQPAENNETGKDAAKRGRKKK
ncbi:regulator of chromosome condensation [Anastrepha obliqua]|uniref:regulator of chromosome condensation n=1 Tax=Anastrepha obliqua TaxID=95512 RepID=UPI002408FD7F|nr:regulator of chromosome condensation [Anastrepha obliqua]XP_054731519.1 regulator of chromosome condensation [Anastrepha obliqua]